MQIQVHVRRNTPANEASRLPGGLVAIPGKNLAVFPAPRGFAAMGPTR